MIEYLRTEIKEGEEANVFFINGGIALGETFIFEAVLEADGTCYLYPPDMFFPHAVFKSDEFKADFIRAFDEYYDDALQPKDNMFRYDVEEFNFQARSVELMGDPKRQIYKPLAVTSLAEGFEKLITPETAGGLHCNGKLIWVDSDYYTGLRDLVNTTSNLALKNMMRFRMILRFALFGKRPTSLARLYYRYTHFMNEPPNVALRCLDAMEPVWRTYYVDFLRRLHVQDYGDISPAVGREAKKALENLVGHVIKALRRSVLQEEDVDVAINLLRNVTFELFYPWKLTDRRVSPVLKAMSAIAV